MRPEEPIACARLAATVSARCCVLRQRACDGSGTRDRWRGQCATFPTCAGCLQGQAIREELDRLIPASSSRPREAPPEQLEARRRLRLAGLLEPVPSMDEPPGEACYG